MSVHLRADQRWLLICDRSNCANRIVADDASHDVQRSQLSVLAEAAHWRRLTAECVDLCAEHAVDAPKPIERGCTVRVWCCEPHGHEGNCTEAMRRVLPPTDFGPEASRRRRW